MFGTLCLIVAQAVTVAPQFVNPVEHPHMRSIVVERVAANTSTRRSRRAVVPKGAGELEPQVEPQYAFDSVIAEHPVEPMIEPLIPAPKSVQKETVVPKSIAPKATSRQSVPGNESANPPGLFEIRDPARVSWLDRFSLEEVRIESSHTDFNVNQNRNWSGNAEAQTPFNESPSLLEPVPFNGQSVVRPPLVPNTPYRPYRFPDSPEQYRASVSQGSGGSTCTNCGCTLGGPNSRCTNTKCGCGR